MAARYNVFFTGDTRFAGMNSIADGVCSALGGKFLGHGERCDLAPLSPFYLIAERTAEGEPDYAAVMREYPAVVMIKPAGGNPAPGSKPV